MAGGGDNRGSYSGGRGGGGGSGRGRGQRGGGGRRGGFRGRNRVGNRGRGRGGGLGFEHVEDIDFVVQRWADDNPPSRRGSGSPSNFPAASGRSTPISGMSSPRGRGRGGYDSPRGRGGRGGRGGSKLRPDAPLSKLLYQERPLLRPIKFVKSQFTPTLFQNQDEVLEPIVESAGDEEASHVPTAERVARVFSGGAPSKPDEDELEEIDFQDLHRLSQLPEMIVEPTVTSTEHIFTGLTEPTKPIASELTIPDQLPLPEQHQGVPEPPPTFFIDTDPAPSPAVSLRYNRIQGITTVPLGQIDDDEEQIVYVAPHPRVSQSRPPSVMATPSQREGTLLAPYQPTVLSTISDKPITDVEPPSIPSLNFTFEPSPRKQPRQAPVFTTSARSKAIARQRVLQGRIKKRRLALGGFGAYGAMMSEAQLRGEEPMKDPKWEERRRGDSDVDWGDDDDGGDDDGSGGIDGVDGIGRAAGMDLDPDLEPNIEALKSFVRGMGAQASNHVTMDDVADEEMMKAEDELEEISHGSSGDEGKDENDENNSTDDEEVNAIINAEEELIISETLDVNLSIKDDDEDESEDDEDASEEEDDDDPHGGFQARLQRIRSRAKGKARVAQPDSEDDDASEDEDMGWSRADEDDDYIAQIQASQPRPTRTKLLDENSDILKSGSRTQSKIFRAIQDGDFDDLEEFNTPRRAKDKGANLPPELVAQWEKDRQRKAENKRARALARLELAADPYSTKKGGKKGRKAMLAAAKIDPSSLPMENRIIDMQTLEIQIRGFIRNLDGPRSMSLPPMRKDLRALVHEMALAFNLKSKSDGKGDARYTTLTKTTRTGLGINEAKIGRIIRRSGGRGYQNGSVNGPQKSSIKMRDGDEVGKAAPKIGQANLGFKMLAAMGWAEGDKIGLSGGLDDPLTAIIKHTRLGLGATH